MRAGVNRAGHVATCVAHANDLATIDGAVGRDALI
jgi:hypothetical protein